MRYFMHIITTLPHYHTTPELQNMNIFKTFVTIFFPPKFIPINPDFKILLLYLWEKESIPFNSYLLWILIIS